MQNIDVKTVPGRLPGGLRDVDLQLLDLFVRIHRLRNLTAAGEELGLSQPAVSRGLARLRQVYDDALFVRQQRGVQATPLAERLAAPLAAALEMLRGTVERQGFEPAAAIRVFRIAMSDIGERYFLTRLLEHLAPMAPGVEVQTCQPSLPELSAGLVSGEIDLVVGFLPELGKQFHHQCLFHEHFVYIARRDHPVVQGSLDVKTVRALAHVVADPPGTPHASTVEQALTSRRRSVRVALRVSSFLSVGPIVAGTDLVAVVPNNLAALVASHVPLQLVEPPLRIPGFDIAMGWHQRFHRDPANEWLRGVFVELFQTR